MRIIILSIILNFVVYANLIKQENLYNLGKYEESLQEAKESKNDRSSYKYHLVWAKSAEALCKDDEAMHAYERVLILDEDNIEAKVALVNLYRYTDRDELALEMDERLDYNILTNEQKKSLYRSKHRSIHSVKLYASLAIGDDSNINSSPESEALDDYIGTTGSVGDISARFSKFFAQLSYKNEIGTKGGWYTKTSTRTYFQDNKNESLYNIFVGSLETALGYDGRGYSFYIPVSYDYIKYLKRNLFNQYKTNPRITISFLNRYILSLNASYSKRFYIEEADKTRDDTTTGLGASIYYMFDKNLAYINTKYENISSNLSMHALFIDKVVLTTTLGIQYNLVSDIYSKVEYRFKNSTYEDIFNSNLVKRIDKLNQIELKISNKISENMEVYLSDKYSKNYSNYAPVIYNKNIVMFGLTLSY